MSFRYPTRYSQGAVLSKYTDHLRAVGYKVKTKGFILETENGREYTTWVAVVLILFFIGFLIYWFTRKKNRITVDATEEE